jgi:dimeric dUTPase (all-alpha-NTP-PPase superfamily)
MKGRGTKLDLKKIFAMQSELNMRIIREHNLEGVSLSKERRLAFLVELGELANETRCFKYWSNRPPSEKNIILEEYVDGLHFVLSIGLELSIAEVKLANEVELQTKMDKLELNELFLSLYQIGAKRLSVEEFEKFFEDFLCLGVKLGFTFAEIEKAYLDKNAINHERQDTGY